MTSRRATSNTELVAPRCTNGYWSEGAHTVRLGRKGGASRLPDTSEGFQATVVEGTGG
jgi:hypothetical protein